MSQFEKFLIKILSGKSDHNIDFIALCQFLKQIGFQERIKGSHHIFTKNGVEEIINIQAELKSAKAYQVKQIRNIILTYKLGEKE